MKNVIKYAVVVVAVVLAAFAANLFFIKAVSTYVVNNVLNECQVCGARTLERYRVQIDSGEIVWVCPLCAQEM